MPPKTQKVTITLEGEPIDFKQSALRTELKVPKDYKFTKPVLERLKKKETGDKFKFLDNEFKMTPLLKRRINFALVLMGRDKK